MSRGFKLSDPNNIMLILIAIMLFLFLGMQCRNSEYFSGLMEDTLPNSVVRGFDRLNDLDIYSTMAPGNGNESNNRPLTAQGNQQLPNSSRPATRPNSSRPATRPNSSGPPNGQYNNSKPVQQMDRRPRPDIRSNNNGDVPQSGVGCSNSEFVSGNLLPKNESILDESTFEFAPKDLQNINFLDATTRIGVDTVSSSLRNANYQIRSEPPNPRNNVSPWMNSTIDPDLERKALET